MFRDSGQSYWETLKGRAWILTRDLFGWNLGTGVITGICTVAGVVLHAANRGRQEALDNLMLTLIYAAPFAVAAPLSYAFNILRAARMVHGEQQQEIERHEDALAAHSRKAGLGDALIALRREGVALRNRPLQKTPHPSVDGLALAGWKDEVDDWERRVRDSIRGQVSAQDYGRFETLDTFTEKTFGWQINSLHAKYLSMLSRRIEILLEIMGQF